MKRNYEQVGVAMTCRSFEEYEKMFQLTTTDLTSGEVLDVAAGSSSFVAEARSLGYDAYAVDPRYGRPTEQWIAEARGEIVTSTAKLTNLKDMFDWRYYGSIEAHRYRREQALELVEQHLETATNHSYYVSGANASL